MADSTTQFVNQTQDATRAIYGAFQGFMGTQANVLQRLGEVQQGLFGQVSEAANEQLQIVSQVKDPREFASAQADLVKRHGQRYADTVKQTVDIVAEAWEEYGDKLENGMNTVTNKAQKAAKKAS